jgi:uncharacterized protein
MTTIFIFHGVRGHPKENWFDWLRIELEKLGHEVIVPQFPTPKGQTLENWLKVLDEYKDKINKDTIFIGHSLGVSFALNIIEKHAVKAAFLVAGFTSIINHEFDEGMKTFAQRNFDWETINKNCKQFYVFHSDNDPYVALEKGKGLANNLESKLVLVEGAGHFGASAGYTTFPLLLEHVKKEL